MVSTELTLYERQDALFSNPQTLDTICVHVANGGSLIDLCNVWKIPYGRVTHWLRSERSRNKPYMDAMNDRQEWYREAILRELRFMATSDLRTLYNEEGGLLPMSEWNDATASCVQSVETDELFEGSGRDKVQIGHTRKLKLWSKEKSLELIGKYLQMFTTRVEVDGAITLAEMVNASIDAKVIDP